MLETTITLTATAFMPSINRLVRPKPKDFKYAELSVVAGMHGALKSEKDCVGSNLIAFHRRVRGIGGNHLVM